MLSRWEKAQEEEIQCWINIKDKVLHQDYLDVKKTYWNKIIQKIENLINGDKNYLDIGCGPSGIFIALSKRLSKEDNQSLGVDPLMDSFLNYFPYLSQFPIDWIKGAFEEINIKRKFDVIFAFNSLDHMRNSHKVVKKMRRLLLNNGVVVVSLNLHTNQTLKRIFEKIYFLDPLHPYQWTINDVIKLFEDHGFQYLMNERIDKERLFLEKKVAHLNSITHISQTPRATNFFGLTQKIIRKFIFKTLELIGYPSHSKTPEGKSIWAQYLLIFSKNKNNETITYRPK